MSRKEKKEPSPPSKAYLVSFGDTMTALLAFFIVLNSLAKDQTGAKMYAGTGSFLSAVRSLGVPGEYTGDRSGLTVNKDAPTPVYVAPNMTDQPSTKKGVGPDDKNDRNRIINLQADNFQRFLNEMARHFAVDEISPTRDQVVLDTWEKVNRSGDDPLGPKALQIAADAISQINNPEIELEVIVWSNMPSPNSLQRAIDLANRAQAQVDRLFAITPEQRTRIRFSAKPWLFVDAKRPIISFSISKLNLQQ